MLISIECVFLDFWDARGLGLLFVVCACAVGLRGNRLTGMRGTWGVVWRSAHVPTIPFTWLRRANALGPTAHASNYQALLSIKLCKQCGSNSCVRVFIIPWGHVNNHDHIWAFVTSMGSPDLNARFWLVEKISAALWLVTSGSSLYDYLPCLELCTPFTCCKSTVISIEIHDKNRTFSQLYKTMKCIDSTYDRFPYAFTNFTSQICNLPYTWTLKKVPFWSGTLWWPRTAIRNFLDNSRKFNFCNRLILKLLHFFYKENIKDVFSTF